MSISTASAWRPEIRRRPAIRTARTTPTARTATTRIQSIWWSCVASALSITAPVSQMSAIAAPWDSTARTIETVSESLYGRRNPSSRANVWR